MYSAMKRKTDQLVAKAQDAIEAAELLLRGDKNDSTETRSFEPQRTQRTQRLGNIDRS